MEGLATTDAPVVADRPVDGLHEYVLPPEAVKVVLLPLQMVALVVEDEMLKVGPATAVTLTVALAEQPKASTPVTV